MANYLGHNVAQNYSGADAIDQKMEMNIEYKSTISKDIQIFYNGIFCTPWDWEDKEEYLRKHILENIKCIILHHLFGSYDFALNV